MPFHTAGARFRRSFVAAAFLAIACPAARALAQADSAPAAAPPPVPREFRAVWLTTVNNSDWPSKPGLSTWDAQQELLAILNKAAALKLNAVVFHIRPGADAMYASKLEPWSQFLTGREGRPPEPAWDPLAFAVREAHKRGLELHAWFNPYRAHYTRDSGQAASTHVMRTHPELVRPYGHFIWMDPGEPEVRHRAIRAIVDVVNRYDVDGVHIDDYFYPYPEMDSVRHSTDFPDSATYARYVKRGGRLAKDDWRRHNVDLFVQEMFEAARDAGCHRPHSLQHDRADAGCGQRRREAGCGLCLAGARSRIALARRASAGPANGHAGHRPCDGRAHHQVGTCLRCEGVAVDRTDAGRQHLDDRNIARHRTTTPSAIERRAAHHRYGRESNGRGEPSGGQDPRAVRHSPRLHSIPRKSMRICTLLAALLAATPVAASPLFGQDTTVARSRRAPNAAAARRRSEVVITDTARARELFVSKDPKDNPGCGNQCAAEIAAKHRTDSIYTVRSRGVMDFRKVSYESRVDGLEIPAYLFAPIDKGPQKHAALVWVHGGVHGDWGPEMLPFVREAVQRGYVVITPDYRGSTGYGDAYFRLIDYGGKEVDDVISAVDYLATLPYVDMDRLGIMGWSHGGFITAHVLFRGETPFRAGAAIVPVTNLVFRLSDHGPSYQRFYAAEEGIQGLPFEKIDEYLKRSPVFHVENLRVPILVHVATNDCDVYFREDQQMVYTLRALKPDLAETKIYVDPPPGHGGCGHTFSRRVDPVTLEREDTPEQIDSWERTWTFFEWNLRPMRK